MTSTDMVPILTSRILMMALGLATVVGLDRLHRDAPPDPGAA
ncbi:MAG TPA: hypothetical protein VIL79_08010 [Thermoleophilia bacterium]